MKLNNADERMLAGFGERVSFLELRGGRMVDVPSGSFGVYAVVYPFAERPTFLERGSCGDFQGAPYSLSDLESWWVPASRLLYFGKAGGPGIDVKLYGRVQKYSSFGLGNDVPHGGGRAIWQIQGAEHLLVCWRSTPNLIPRRVEEDLIADFVKVYGMRPFANQQD